jgi:hypothetical protein
MQLTKLKKSLEKALTKEEKGDIINKLSRSESESDKRKASNHESLLTVDSKTFNRDLIDKEKKK